MACVASTPRARRCAASCAEPPLDSASMVERIEPSRAAHVSHPRPDGHRGGNLGNHGIRNAQQDELGIRVCDASIGDAQAALQQPGADRAAGAAGADDVDALDHRCRV